jgi:hypothetical protein
MWLLLNLDMARVEIPQLKIYLPTEWDIDVSGRVKFKVGKIKLPKVTVTTINLPSAITLPSVPNLNISFNVGGVADDNNVIAQVNQSLTELGFGDFSCQQREEGTVEVTGSGQSEGVNFAFIPDEESVEQVSEDTPPSVDLDDSGLYTVVTTKGIKFKLRPAPRDTTALLKLMPNGRIQVGKRGETP